MLSNTTIACACLQGSEVAADHHAELISEVASGNERLPDQDSLSHAAAAVWKDLLPVLAASAAAEPKFGAKLRSGLAAALEATMLLLGLDEQQKVIPFCSVPEDHQHFVSIHVAAMNTVWILHRECVMNSCNLQANTSRHLVSCYRRDQRSSS